MSIGDLDLFGEQAATDSPAEREQEPVEIEQHEQLAQPTEEAYPDFIGNGQFKGPLVFDIETGPIADEALARLFTFDITKMEGYEFINAEFDPETVKLGNTKDPEKRAAKVREEREKFAKAKQKAIDGTGQAQADAFAKFRDSAALDARTAQVLAIGYMDMATGQQVVDDGDSNEQTLLKTFWDTVQVCQLRHCQLIGFNIAGFDVPMLARRAMLHGIVLPPFRNGRYLDKIFLDLREVWGCGEYSPKGSLDDLSVFFGGPAKNGDGAMFYKLWNGTDADFAQAVAYLKNDLTMTAHVARALQVL